MLAAVFVFGHQTAAQSLTFSLFERYLGALRDQAGIPGMAAAIVQHGEVVWFRGFGYAKIEGSFPVLRDTPFAINELTQTVTASLILQQCIDRGEVVPDDSLQRWSPSFADRSATFRQVLSHTTSSGYRFDRERYRALTGAVEECADRPFALTMAQEVLIRFTLSNAVPGGDVRGTNTEVRRQFSTPELNRYIAVLQGIATPYRVDSNRRATPSTYQLPPLSATDGLVASLDDLVKFDNALDTIVQRSTLDGLAWQRQGSSPMGLGWFVQQIGDRQVVWHFGQSVGAYSSLMVKVPREGLTLILLANSDGLSVPFPLANGDVTVSPFARIFLSFLG